MDNNGQKTFFFHISCFHSLAMPRSRNNTKHRFSRIMEHLCVSWNSVQRKKVLYRKKTMLDRWLGNSKQNESQIRIQIFLCSLSISLSSLKARWLHKLFCFSITQQIILQIYPMPRSKYPQAAEGTIT